MDVSLDASMGGTDGLVVHVDKNRVGVRGCPIMTVREEKNTQMPSHGGMIIGVDPEMCFACFILLETQFVSLVDCPTGGSFGRGDQMLR